MTRKQTDVLGSFAKGLAIIEVFSADRPRLSITEAAQAAGFDRATARRCLLTLTEHGYALYDGKYFTLTPRILRLGAACLATMPLTRIVQPMLDRLSTETGQSSSVSILDDHEIVYVARAAQQRLMSINLSAGSRLPAYCTSMGRILLASLGNDAVRGILANHPPAKFTPKTITSADKLLRIIAKVRKDGFAIIDQEIEIGLRSIAVPIFDSRGRTVAALNIGVAAVQDSAEELKQLYLAKLLAVQASLRSLLG